MVRAEAIEALARLGDRDSIPDLVFLIRETDLWIPEMAIKALQALGATEAVPELVPALAAPEERTRLAAAAALCEFGSRKGIDVILEEEDRLDALNALRNPAALKRLRASRLPDGLSGGTSKELVEALAASAGLKVEWSPNHVADNTWIAIRRKASPEVQNLLGRTGWMILDDDRIRVMAPDEAVRFWKSWASKP